jgi:2-polyprenyl-3-methyl-5-hydroxy-6-metoxy-1,4-benzoquinol methylase
VIEQISNDSKSDDSGHIAVHEHGAGIAMEDRHAHERETYDAMAVAMLAEMTDSELLVRADGIPFANREHVDFLSFAIGEVGPLAHRRVLEVGAGSGSLAVWLALQGADVTGIDVSEGILQVAAKRAAVSGASHRTRFVTCPIEEFDEPPASYDVIIGNNVVHHFDRDPALANIARLITPDGRAVFCEPVLFAPEVLRRLRYSAAASRRFPPHTHTPDERSLNRGDLAVAARHFGTLHWYPFQLLCRLQNFVELSDPAWNRLESVDRFALRNIRVARWLARMIVLVLDEPRTIDPNAKERFQ